MKQERNKRGAELEVGSLFSGIGGIEYGFERAGGFKTIWNCETNPYASAILKKHWPSVPNLGNITKVDWTKVRRPDLICGGFPCQDISNAGKRAGITGKRSGLWKEYAKAIRILRPRYVFIENVSALLGRGLDVVLADLASCGYDAEWDCIPAQAVGAPHRRDRVFIVAYTNCGGLLHRQAQEQPAEAKLDAPRESISEGSDVANANSRCLAENKIYAGGQISNKRSFSNTNSEGLERRENPQIFEDSRAHRNEFTIRCNKSRESWAVEPGICRVVNGLSNRIHRIKCLGNSVVPQVAQFIAERIKERGEKP